MLVLALAGLRRQPPLVEYIASAAAVSHGAGSSTDHGLGVDPGPSSTVAVFVMIRNDMSVDERSLAYAHGGIFVVNARLLVPDLLTGRVCPRRWTDCREPCAHGGRIFG